ncbi:Hypothetical protein DHA2_7353 [Giardia duodenalis]|uniref:Uncharacterized protein n=1 Tax=Giardia intestinalis TaxID=5741 RepID=V6TA38_GIAIN|nr:Hypothetical protein DHA2_7353 [Giardia intestinalis]
MSLARQITEIKREGQFLMQLSSHYEHIVAHMTYECIFFMALLFDAYIIITESKLITTAVRYYFPIHILIFNALISFSSGVYLSFSSMLIIRAKDPEEMILSLRNYIITTVLLQHTKYPLVLLAGSMLWGFVTWKYLHVALGLSLIIAIVITLCSYALGVLCALLFVIPGDQWEEYTKSIVTFLKQVWKKIKRRCRRCTRH